VYQGEARLVKDNVFLGNIEVPLPSKKKGEVDIEVRFTYDVSGVLEAEVLLPQTGERYKAIISDNAGVLTPEQIAQRFTELDALKIHPRDQMENRTLLARAERLYQQLRGDLREHLGRQIIYFEQALETQDKKQFGPAAEGFGQLLDELEHQSFLPDYTS
jgi:molecular chaperone HscC